MLWLGYPVKKRRRERQKVNIDKVRDKRESREPMRHHAHIRRSGQGWARLSRIRTRSERHTAMETIMTTTTNPPFRWRLIVHQLPLYHFQQHIIARHGIEEYDRLRARQTQVILPIVSFSDMLTVALFLLDPY